VWISRCEFFSITTRACIGILLCIILLWYYTFIVINDHQFTYLHTITLNYNECFFFVHDKKWVVIFFIIVILLCTYCYNGVTILSLDVIIFQWNTSWWACPVVIMYLPTSRDVWIFNWRYIANSRISYDPSSPYLQVSDRYLYLYVLLRR